MRFTIEKPTYIYKKPVIFQHKEYHNSEELAEAFLEKWNLAVSAFRAGVFLDFWKKYVEVEQEVIENNHFWFHEIYDRMWDVDAKVNLDVLFTKVFHMIEPAIQEVPYWEPGAEEVSLYSVERLQENYKDSSDAREKWIFYVGENGFDSRYNKEYDENFEEIHYLCHMLREEVFSLWGYEGAETPFVKALPKIGKDISEFVNAFHRSGDRLYDRKVFLWKGTACRTTDEFAALWISAYEKWDINEWNQFLEELFEKKENAVSIFQWLKELGEDTKCNALKKLEQQWREKAPFFDFREHCPKANYIDYESCFRWTNQEGFLQELDSVERKVEEILPWIKNNSLLEKALKAETDYRKVYCDIHEIFGIVQPDWSSSYLGKRLRWNVEEWKEWEVYAEQTYHRQKKWIDCVRVHDLEYGWKLTPTDERTVLCSVDLGNDEGELVGEGDNRVLLLLFCAPVEEHYQARCNACLEYLQKVIPMERKRAEGEQKADNMINNIEGELYWFIYILLKSIILPMVVDQAPDDVVGFYMSFLAKLLEQFPVVKSFDDGKIEECITKVKDLLIRGANFKPIWNPRLVSSSDIKVKESRLKRLPSNANHKIKYTEFYASESYQAMEEEKKTLQAIGQKWVQSSENIEEKEKEIISYMENQWDIDKYTEYKNGLKNKVSEYEQLVSEHGQVNVEWDAQFGKVNLAVSNASDAKKIYEAMWEKRQQEEKEAERQRKIKIANRKKVMRKIRNVGIAVGVVVSVTAVVMFLASKWIENLSPWKVEGDTLIGDYSYESIVINTPDVFAKRLKKVVDDEGTLVISKEAYQIGSLGFGMLKNKGKSDELGMKKLVLPQNVQMINSSFDISGYTQLEEVEFPDSLTKIDGNWKRTGIRSLYAQNVRRISSTDITGGVFSDNDFLQNIDLPMLENVDEYTFYDCDSLREISLNSAEFFGQRAFAGCENLQVVNLPMAQEFDHYVFEGCTALQEVVLPAVTKISLSSFYGCTNLGNVYLPAVEKIYFNKALTSGRIYIGPSVQLVDFQYVPTPNEAGDIENVLEKHTIEIVLDANSEYLPTVMEAFHNVTSHPDIYGDVKIVYEDYAAMNMFSVESAVQNDESVETHPYRIYRWNSHYYAFFSEASFWNIAVEKCKEQGGYMASITSAEEDAAIYQFLIDAGYRDAFFGLNDKTDEGNWTWVNGETVAYTNWHPGEPNSQLMEEDYAHYYKAFGDGTWNDSSYGGWGSVYICEWDEYPWMIHTVFEQ